MQEGHHAVQRTYADSVTGQQNQGKTHASSVPDEEVSDDDEDDKGSKDDPECPAIHATKKTRNGYEAYGNIP